MYLEPFKNGKKRRWIGRIQVEPTRYESGWIDWSASGSDHDPVRDRGQTLARHGEMAGGGTPERRSMTTIKKAWWQDGDHAVGGDSLNRGYRWPDLSTKGGSPAAVEARASSTDRRP